MNITQHHIFIGEELARGDEGRSSKGRKLNQEGRIDSVHEIFLSLYRFNDYYNSYYLNNNKTRLILSMILFFRDLAPTNMENHVFPPPQFLNICTLKDISFIQKWMLSGPAARNF